ncbi:SDR family oxidoreductase [Paracoccus sp. (in: a-proteobacteria)]|uniref:SDR family oxidoreductase n=1 Tax=Paracoccus sp. TaxID=267 RepID=UPI00396C77C8
MPHQKFRARSRGDVVVITGASSGIGEATAEAYARKGARLVLAARDGAALEAVAERCRQKGGQAVAVATDVGNAQQVMDLAEAALAFGGRIDVWIANVGVGAVGAFQDVPIEAHQQVIQANLIGHMNEAHAVLPVFLRQKAGIFINMISLGGFAAAPYAAAYSASKFGLRGFSEALRGELAGHPRIHVCDVYPSFVDTPGIAHGANYTGRKLSAPPPLLDARSVAAAMLHLSRHPRPTTMLGSPTYALRLMHALSPQLTAMISGGFLRAYFARAEAMPRSEGSLFSPPARPGGIDGGLRSPRQRAIMAGVVLAGVAGGLALARRPHRRERERS